MIVNKQKFAPKVNFVDPDEKRKLRLKIRRLALNRLFEQVKFV